MRVVAITLHIILILSFACEVYFLIVFGNHTERNILFLGPLLESDIFHRLIGDTSFLLCIRLGVGKYLVSLIYFFCFFIGSIRLSQWKFCNELVLLGAPISCTEVK